MSSTTPPAITEPRPSKRRGGLWIGLGVAAVVAAVVAVGVVAFQSATKTPHFPKLADTPDQTLHGTVAYWNYNCVTVASISGAATRQVVCNSNGEVAPIENVVWLPDGRLQVMTGTDAYAVHDVVRGTSEVISASEAVPVPSESSSTNSRGETVAATNDGGHVTVTVAGANSTRTLLDANGGDQYSIGTPQWSADESVVLVHDAADRILVITTGEQPTTRTLAESAAILYGSTSEDLLTTSG